MPMFSPSHPGDLIRETIEGLREETGTKLTLEEVATGLGTTRKTLSAIINRRQSVTPEMAIRLAAAFRNTTAEFWLEVQERYALAEARKRVSTAGVRVFWDVAEAAQATSDMTVANDEEHTAALERNLKKSVISFIYEN